MRIVSLQAEAAKIIEGRSDKAIMSRERFAYWTLRKLHARYLNILSEKKLYVWPLKKAR
jgi:hypothetical protein